MQQAVRAARVHPGPLADLTGQVARPVPKQRRGEQFTGLLEVRRAVRFVQDALHALEAGQALDRLGDVRAHRRARLCGQGVQLQRQPGLQRPARRSGIHARHAAQIRRGLLVEEGVQ